MSEASGASTRGERWLAAAIAALALAPYAAIACSFETGLRLLAAIIAAILALVGVAAWRGLVAGVRGLPRAVRWGLVLYGGAAAWGVAVGAASGNPLRWLASQVFGMALLPLGAVVFAAHPSFRARTLARGLAVAALAALAVHALAITVPWLGQALGAVDGRMALRYTTGFGGRDVIALLVTADLALATGSRLAVAGALASFVLVVGTMSRGGWVAAALGLLVIGAGVAARASRRTRIACGAAVAVVVLLSAVAVWTSRGTLLARVDFEHRPAGALWASASAAKTGNGAAELAFPADTARRELTPVLPVAAPIVIVDCWLSGDPGRRASLWVSASDQGGRAIRTFSQPVTGRPAWQRGRHVVHLPPGSAGVQVGLAGRDAHWLVDDLEVVALPGKAALAARLVRDRLVSIGGAALRPEDDGTVSYRLAELDAVLLRWRAASPWRLLAGHGLGARFAFRNAGWSPDGRRIALPEASYIHNFYVFLGFKLGVAGIAALAGLLLIAAAAAASAWRSCGRTVASWILPTATAVWAAYLVWGITSPEVIDPAVAPLLGALIAAAGQHGPGDERAPLRAPR